MVKSTMLSTSVTALMALKVACPKCGAEPLQKCVGDLDSSYLGRHASRAFAYMIAAEKAGEGRISDNDRHLIYVANLARKS